MPPVRGHRPRHPVGVGTPSHRLARTAQPGVNAEAAAVLRLQQLAGNRAVKSMLGGAPRRDFVQRDRQPPATQPGTRKWTSKEHSTVKAKLHRTTDIVVDDWGEVGPAPPRIKFDRSVSLEMADGAEATVGIWATVRLNPGEKLPASPEIAFAAVGREASGGWSVNAEWGDLVPYLDSSRYVLPLSSMEIFTHRLPPYALWSDTPAQQEAALLKFVASLPRRKKAPAPDEDRRARPDRVAGGGGAGTGGARPAGGGRRSSAPPSQVLETLAVVAADVITDFVPVVGNLKDGYRAFTGRDPVTKEKLGWGSRLLSLLFAIPILGTLLRGVGKGTKLLGRALTSVGKGMAKAGRWLFARPAVRTAIERGRRVVVDAWTRLRGGRRKKAAKLLKRGLPTPAQAEEMVRNARVVGPAAWKRDARHRSAAWAVDTISDKGHVFSTVGRDGVERILIQVKGELDGMAGRFEWILNEAGNVTHNLFVKGGAINGVPIRP